MTTPTVEQTPAVVSPPQTPTAIPLRRSHVVADELDAIVSTVSAKHPDTPRHVIDELVRRAYRDLAATATVTAHLIPLTLNRSMRQMRAHRAMSTQDSPRPRLAAK